MATEMATAAKLGKSFSSGPYLERLMAELDRAGIAVRLKEARERAGLTQVELGEAFEEPMHWRSVQNYESVKLSRVPWNRLDEWARVTGVTKEWLIHGEQPEVTGLADRLLQIERRQVTVLETLESMNHTLSALAAALLEEQPGSDHRG